LNKKSCAMQPVRQEWFANRFDSCSSDMRRRTDR